MRVGNLDAALVLIVTKANEQALMQSVQLDWAGEGYPGRSW